MPQRPSRRTAPALATAVVLSVALVGPGCKPGEEPSADPPPAGPGVPSQGETLFVQKGCTRCHIYRFELGEPKGKGPDLSRVGADPTHTPEWIAAYARDPKSKNPDAQMPRMDGSKVSDQELATITTWLSSLK